VALKPRPSFAEAIAAQVPRVAWGYAEAVAPGDRAPVEALLIGSVQRELGRFEASTMPHLRFVQRLYTGLDGVPFSQFPDSVQVAGNVGGYAPFVAEHAVALLLAVRRDLLPSHRMVAEGRLRPPPEPPGLWGSTVLILGYGAIGREVAARLSGHGVHVVGLNRSGRMAPGVESMFPADRLGEALVEADAVVDARPLTRSTRGSIGGAQLQLMRPTATYVNVGRAAVADEEALYRHAREHPEFRVALDVWWEEDHAQGRLGQRFPWTELPNFLGTPHCASWVPGAEEHALRAALDNLARFFRGETPMHLADRREYEG
jgi:phosphoglycerate dehydrogenase-like enzyme